VGELFAALRKNAHVIASVASSFPWMRKMAIEAAVGSRARACFMIASTPTPVKNRASRKQNALARLDDPPSRFFKTAFFPGSHAHGRHSSLSRPLP